MNRPIRNSRIMLSQGRIFWREVGEGTALVFLHGAWNDSSQWLSLMNCLSEDYHCFAPDLLGFADSDRPDIHYSIELEVECLAQYLEALKLRQVYLVGHSLGGWIAASYALKYIEQVSGLVLLAPLGVHTQGVDNSWRRMGWFVSSPPVIFKLLRFLRPLTKILGLGNKLEQVRQQRQVVLQSPAACKLLFQRRQSEIDAELLQEKLSCLKIPVLILQGGVDTSTASSLSHAYADLIPTAELKIISQGGNDLPQSFPDAVAQHIRDFVKAERMSEK